MELMMTKPPKRIVRMSYLVQATGLSRGTCYREMESNPEFPKKIMLGMRAIGFDADEVDVYVSKLIGRGTIWGMEKLSNENLLAPFARICLSVQYDWR